MLELPIRLPVVDNPIDVTAAHRTNSTRVMPALWRLTGRRLIIPRFCSVEPLPSQIQQVSNHGLRRRPSSGAPSGHERDRSTREGDCQGIPLTIDVR